MCSVVKNCIFVGCDSSSVSAPEKIFLSVPKNEYKRKLWFQAAGRKVPSASSVKAFCCEDHFDLERDASNWIYYKTMGQRIRLKEEVVPKRSVQKCGSQLTPSAKRRKEAVLTLLQSSHGGSRRQLFYDEGVQTQSKMVTSPPEDVNFREKSPSGVFQVKLTPEKLVPAKKPNTRATKWTMTKKVKTYNKLIDVHPEVAEKSTNTHSFAKTQVPYLQDNNLNESCQSISSTTGTSESGTPVSTTGSSITVEDVIEDSEKLEIQKIEKNPRLYLGVPTTEFYVLKELQLQTKLPMQHIYVTLKKIRTNDQFHRLAIDFGKSISGISWIFNKALPIMAEKMSQLIIWPEKAKIQELMPLQFQAYFKNVQVIIDCFEIQIEQPGGALQQSITWSSYKNCNTAKFLIASTPSGLITFVSEAFVGRTSDLEIIQKSGFMDIVPETAVIMADRGFKQIAATLERKKVTLVRPPSVTASMAMTKAEARQSKLVAAVRVHIERLIRRVREFRMLMPHATTDHQMVPLLDDIVKIACGVINLQGPLIRDNS